MRFTITVVITCPIFRTESTWEPSMTVMVQLRQPKNTTIMSMGAAIAQKNAINTNCSDHVLKVRRSSYRASALAPESSEPETPCGIGSNPISSTVPCSLNKFSSFCIPSRSLAVRSSHVSVGGSKLLFNLDHRTIHPA